MARGNLKLLHLPDLIAAGRVLILRADRTEAIYGELNRAGAEQLDALLAMGTATGPATGIDEAGKPKAHQLLVVRTAFGNLTVLAVPEGTGETPSARDTESFERALRGLRAQSFAYSEKNFGNQLGWLASALSRFQKEQREVEIWKGI